MNLISFIFELSNKSELVIMKAKRDIREGFQTKAEEIFGEMPINVRVDFYCGSYQYRDSKFFTIESVDNFEDLRKTILSMLKSDKSNSSPVITDTYWATFTPELEKYSSEQWDYTRYDLSLYRTVLK